MSSTDLGGSSGERRTQAREDASSPKDMAASALETVKAEAASFAASAQDKIGQTVDEKKNTATQTLGDFANAIRKAGDDLAQNDQSLAGRAVKQAADGLESFSRSIGDKAPEDLLNAVRDFGRQNPAAFIAGTVLLGIAIGRLAKSTEQRSGSSPAGASVGSVGQGGATGAARFDDPVSTDLPPSGIGPSSTSYPGTGATVGSAYRSEG